MLDVPTAQIILEEPGIATLVGEGEAAGMAQHVRMGKQGQGSGGAVFRKARFTAARPDSVRRLNVAA